MIAGHFIVSLIILILLFNQIQNWKMDQKPRIYGDHLSEKLISTKIRRVQKRIVFLHNFFRTKVSPPPSNMLNMHWHSGAALAAQKWANQCHYLQHDSKASRTIDNFGACGQNILVATHKVPWLFVLKSWFIERENFTYGSNQNNLKMIGHYTQMVWAATHKIGCALTKCSSGGPGGQPFYNYVCDYCPIGNYEKSLGYPYKIGRACELCPRNCLHKKGLCTNSCNTTDRWANCMDLNRIMSRHWLCNTHSNDGFERRRQCLASCTCEGKIFD